MKSVIRRAVALGSVFLLAAVPSVLAVPVAQGDDGAIEAGVINTGSGILPAVAAPIILKPKCLSAGGKTIDQPLQNTCTQAPHNGYCDKQGNFQCDTRQDLCKACVCG